MLSNSAEDSLASHTMYGDRLPASGIKAAEPDAKPHLQIRGGVTPRALRRVREYVEAHLDETISLEQLAGVAGLSKYHFARAFKQSEGVTPHEYLVRWRVRRARELLAGTELPLSEIALASGFSDQSHFARRFRERVDVTPSCYRWSMR